MTAISIEQAQSELPKLIAQLSPGEEVEITKDNCTIAKLVRQQGPRQFGLGKGKLRILQDDEETLEDFAEYMP